MTTMPPIVSIDELADHPDAVIADVRWYLDGTDARAVYENGHLPGAIFIDLEHDLTTSAKGPTAGRHPLPDPDAFAAAMSSHGIGDDSVVIAYDDTGGMTAGRLVVMLRMLGRNAAVLDGGISQWSGELMIGPGVIPEQLDFTPCAWPLDRLASEDEVEAVAESGHGLLLDARATERFTGEVTQIDPRPGHVPSAASAPWSANIDPQTRRFRPAAEIRARFNDLGVSQSDNVITYCGSGVSACANILAMEHAGLPPARLYVASFSGWSADPDRPVELGPGR
jgi:thiosulfate/3-mercaptopyruvate sulfurtransferase